MIVAVTGATGFIGSRLCARLLAEGVQVRALARDPTAARRLLGAGVAICAGDLDASAQLAACVRDADAVIHAAGAVRGTTRADFDAVNVAGTGKLLDALDSAAPAASLLFLSSLAAREPGLSHYAASKRAAENLLLARRGAHRCAMLRPPAVYGPGDREMLPVFRFMASTGLAPCAGHAQDRLSLVYVDDLVEAILAWLRSDRDQHATWTLHDGKPGGYDWSELCATVAAACGRPVRCWEIPRLPLDLVARGIEGVARLGGRAPMLTPAKLRELRHPDWVCDNAAITAALGWEPNVALAEGLALTPGWHG